jgi:ABC-type transport system involved in multi-copper enzyme maturation permease subunit
MPRRGKLSLWKIVGWWAVLSALFLAGELLHFYYHETGQYRLAELVPWPFRLVGLGWLAFGAVVWRENRWVQRLSSLAIASIATYLLASFFHSIGQDGLSYGVISALGMGLTFIGGMWLVRQALRGGHPIFGVASTVVAEAMRMRVPLVFLVLLTLAIPFLPFILAEDQLRYQLQSFLSYALTSTSLLLSLMTLFLAVGSVANELKHKQAHLTLTKPVSRLHYLIGKWLGISLMNLVLVAITGMAIFAFAQLIATREAASDLDRVAVQEEVLVARTSARPMPPPDMNLQERAEQRLFSLQQQLPEVYGPPGAPMSSLDADTRQTIAMQALADWTSIGPRQSTAFLFTGLGPAKQVSDEVQFVIHPKAGGEVPDNLIRLQMRVNGQPWFVPRVSVDSPHVLRLPTGLIADSGQLLIELRNPVEDGVEQPTIRFNRDDGIEVLYRVGDFRMNLLRAMTIVWLRLAFVAMLGLALGALMSFPIAALLGIVIVLASIGSEFIAQSLSEYSAFPSDELPILQRVAGVPALIVAKFADGDWWAALRIVIRLIGSAFTAMLPSLGKYDPQPNLIEGRLVSWPWVGAAAFWIGLCWTGGVCLIGYFFFRRRELAKVQV